eukprot:TRINITY_DN22876_c0_g1_i1.p1 TRINITY_DN22876_c0_g1~~TRINITY_DN22876_c0_g1_i1.p1  ORF type:complete len:285 (+),score=27.60 TRINITY_DN22876_c0_g1_i1:58-912(+)
MHSGKAMSLAQLRRANSVKDKNKRKSIELSMQNQNSRVMGSRKGSDVRAVSPKGHVSPTPSVASRGQLEIPKIASQSSVDEDTASPRPHLMTTGSGSSRGADFSGVPWANESMGGASPGYDSLVRSPGHGRRVSIIEPLPEDLPRDADAELITSLTTTPPARCFSGSVCSRTLPELDDMSPRAPKMVESPSPSPRSSFVDRIRSMSSTPPPIDTADTSDPFLVAPFKPSGSVSPPPPMALRSSSTQFNSSTGGRRSLDGLPAIIRRSLSRFRDAGDELQTQQSG